MKRNIHKNLLGMLKSKGILAISGGLLLMSCGAQMGGYSETDGVYYDPNKDTLPEGVIINGNEGNRVGEYYDYYQDDSNLIQNAEANSNEGRYDSWNDYNGDGNATDSDWGNFAGSQTNYYDSSWGSPWGWYGGYSPYWGMNRGWGLGLSWGWGGSWGYNSFWNMGWGYSPYWGGYYDPFWGGYGYGYGYPYYGGGYYGGGYWGNYRRSGASGRGFNSYNGGFTNKNGNNAGLRTAFRQGNTNNSGFRQGNGGFRQGQGGFRGGNNGGFRQGNNGGFRQGNGNMNGGFRNQSGYRRPQQNYNYQQQQQQQPSYRNDGGFRSSGGYNSNSGGGGGFRGGSSGGGGGFRSGGGGGGGGFRGGR